MSQVITYKCDVCEEGMVEAVVEGSKPAGFGLNFTSTNNSFATVGDWSIVDLHVCRECLLMLEKTCKQLRDEGKL